MARQRFPVDLVALPFRPRAPLSAVGRRVGFSIGLLVFIAAVVYIGRDGYNDSAGGEIGFGDALYYASVTVTTTGYGDISAVTPATRLAALFLITPARILFLILVVGTTVEVLTERSRQLLITQNWRQRVNDHYVICGYGSTGQSAGAALIAQGVPKGQVVVVDEAEQSLDLGRQHGFTTVQGDASRIAVLEQAGTDRAKSVIVTPNRDDTAVLITLTVRELNESANIVAAGREKENLHLLRQSGANAVIDSSAAVGRLLGIATQTPSALKVIDDLLEAGSHLELADVAPVAGESQLEAPEGTTIIEVLRGDRRVPYGDPSCLPLQSSDRLIVVRTARPAAGN